MSLPVALYQMDSICGDLLGNANAILQAAKTAQAHGAKLLLTPEMSLIGYPAEDWLLRPDFQERATEAIEHLALDLQKHGIQIPVVVGSLQISGKAHPFNAAFVLQKGKIAAVYHKHHLPEYGVFDEDRVFTPGNKLCVFTIDGYKLGLAICEDLWYPDVVLEYAKKKVAGLLIINASPYEWGKQKTREMIVSKHLLEANLPGIYVNCVGGQDELVFDGASFSVDPQGQITDRIQPFKECLTIWNLKNPEKQTPTSLNLPQKLQPLPYTFVTDEDPSREASIYSALVVAIADYVHKNNFQDVVIGLSGGVDSALVASLATDALGSDHVTAIMMPTQFTSNESLDWAKQQAETLGVRYVIYPIETIFKDYLDLFQKQFQGHPWDVTEENLQARIRGSILMGWSNKFSSLVLTTGNKSELAVGYSTLYGDTVGAFAPIKDVYKTEVWKLCKWRNSIQHRAMILPEIINREPSAELRVGQKDQDTLPNYEILDNILYQYIDQRKSVQDIKKLGYNIETAKHIIKLIQHAEYKRRQSPIGPKITEMNFGRDWRFPISWKY